MFVGRSSCKPLCLVTACCNSHEYVVKPSSDSTRPDMQHVACNSGKTVAAGSMEMEDSRESSGIRSLGPWRSGLADAQLSIMSARSQNSWAAGVMPNPEARLKGRSGQCSSFVGFFEGADREQHELDVHKLGSARVSSMLLGPTGCWNLLLCKVTRHWAHLVRRWPDASCSVQIHSASVAFLRRKH